MIIKSIGGKAQQVPELLTMIPMEIGTYFEPFAGSLALYWALKREGRFNGAVVNDQNALLIDVYRAAQNNAQGLIDELEPMRDLRGREAFEAFRSELNGYGAPQAPLDGRPDLNVVDRAARTIYMNRRGFNGLFRVNKSGALNMPWGEDSALTPADKILEAGKMLQGAVIRSGDFEAALQGAQRGDFVFADPPYLDTFSGYSGAFGLREHRRLEKVLTSLDAVGVRWLVCNSETPVVRQIWRKWQFKQVLCRRNANSNGEGRGNVPELRISNY